METRGAFFARESSFDHFFFSHQAFSVEFEDAVFPELAVSARALGMGNVHLAHGNDHYASFYNPAGLGSFRGARYHFGLHTEFNNFWLDSTSGGSFFRGLSKFTSLFELDELRQSLLGHRGKTTHGRFQLINHFTLRFLSVGFLYTKQHKALIEGGDSPFEFAKRTDSGPYVSLALPFWGGIFKVGVTGMLLNREEEQGELPRDESVLVGDDQKRKGEMVLLSGGVRLTWPSPWLPTLAVQTGNLFHKRFYGSGNPPPMIRQSINMGIGVTPWIGNYSKLRMGLDYKDVTGQYEGIKTSRKMGLGMEFDLEQVLFFRLGYGDGFGSAGIGLKTKDVVFDLTTYAVDMAGSGFRKREDRRFALSFFAGF